VTRRRFNLKEIIAKLQEAEILLIQGMSVPEAVRELGIHEATYRRWRKKHHGMGSDQRERLKEVEKENSRIRMQYPT